MSCAYTNYPPQGKLAPCENAWPVARLAAKTTEALTNLGASIAQVPINGWIPLEDSILLMGQDDSSQNGIYTLSEDENAANLITNQTWKQDPARNQQCSVDIPVTSGTSYYARGDWSTIGNGLEEFGPNTIVYAGEDKLTLYGPASLAGLPVVGKIKPAKLVRTQSADESRDFYRGREISAQQGPNAGRYRWRWQDGFNLGSSPVYFDSLGSERLGPSVGFTKEVPQAFTMVCAPATANVAPVITVHPSSVLARPGLPLVLKVEASGSSPMSFQWFKDQQPIPGATSASYSIASMQQADEGNYYCRASNIAGSANSNVASVLLGYAPAITKQPQAADVALGGTATFSVVVTGTPPFTYQWMRDGIVIPGATSSVYSANNVQSIAYYTCRITNNFGQVTSQQAMLSIGNPPTIFVQPKSQTGSSGDSVTLSVTAGGTAPLTYQWFHEGILQAGMTTASVLVEIKGSTEGSYRCLVKNKYGQALSDEAILTMDQANRPPVITTQPKNQTGNVGNNFMLFVVAQGSAPLSYQWQKAGTDMPGQTSSVLQINNAQLADAADYKVIVTNPYGTVTSAVATVTVTAAAGSAIYLGNAGQDLKSSYTANEIIALQQTLPQTNPTNRSGFAGTYEISAPQSGQNEYRVIAAPVSFITGTVQFNSAGSPLPMTVVQDGLVISGTPYRVYRTSSRSAGDFTVAGATPIVVTMT